MGDPQIRREAEAFLRAWFETRKVVQALNFNRFQQEGLSASQFIVLQMIGEREGEHTAASLARALNVRPTTSLRTLATLERRGLVERRRAEADQRRQPVVLTPEGRAAADRLHASFVAGVEAAFLRLGPAARAGLVEGLSLFAASALDPSADLDLEGRRPKLDRDGADPGAVSARSGETERRGRR